MKLEFFNNFDHAQLWDDCEYSLEKYVEEPPSETLIREIEAELGYKLPASYIELMKLHNGGILASVKSCFPCDESTSWSSDHVAVNGIAGIGRAKTNSLCGPHGSQSFTLIRRIITEGRSWQRILHRSSEVL